MCCLGTEEKKNIENSVLESKKKWINKAISSVVNFYK